MRRLFLVLVLALMLFGVPAMAIEWECGYNGEGDFFHRVVAGDAEFMGECSGIVMSRKNSEIFWMHSDGRNPPHTAWGGIAIASNRDGTRIAAYEYGDNLDWEDMATYDGDLYIGLGYNAHRGARAIRVAMFAEPDLDEDTVWDEETIENAEETTFYVKFPSADGDGDMDNECSDMETLMIDPLNGDIYVVSKRTRPNMIFRAEMPGGGWSGSGTTVMDWLADLPWSPSYNAVCNYHGGYITGGEIDATGHLLSLITNGGNKVYIYHRPDDATWDDVFTGSPIPAPDCEFTVNNGQDEAVAFDLTGMGNFYTQAEAHGFYRYNYIREGIADCSDDCIVGNVIYYRDHTDSGSEPSTKAVPDIEVDATELAADTTNVDGYYAFSGLSGSYNVWVEDELSDPDEYAVSATDASMVSQSRVLLVTLSANQFIAADVSGNAKVSSYDAALIAQYGVGIIDVFPVAESQASDWKFLRCDNYASASEQDCGFAQFVHDPLVGPDDNDFYAILYGDVTGNWVWSP